MSKIISAKTLSVVAASINCAKQRVILCSGAVSLNDSQYIYPPPPLVICDFFPMKFCLFIFYWIFLNFLHTIFANILRNRLNRIFANFSRERNAKRPKFSIKKVFLMRNDLPFFARNPTQDGNCIIFCATSYKLDQKSFYLMISPCNQNFKVFSPTCQNRAN